MTSAALRRMSFKKWRVLLAMLAVGALINIAISWYACTPLNPQYPGGLDPIGGNEWSVSMPKDWPPPDVHLKFAKWGSFTEWFETARPKAFSGSSQDEKHWILWTLRAGWPLLSLHGWSYRPPEQKGFDRNFLFLYPWTSKERVDLPWLPIWPGFAVNTLFYAAIAYSLYQLPFVLRRSRRRRKGLCLHCAYSRAGLAPDALCPECGRSTNSL